MQRTKRTRTANATGVTPPRDLPAAASLDRGDDVTVTVCDGRIESDDSYNQAMDVGRAFSARYRRSMAALAK